MSLKNRRWLTFLLVAIVVAAITPAYVRAYRVGGTSDAPSFLEGERVYLLKAAYDLRLPYTGIVVFDHSRPKPGDVVMFHPPGSDATVFKRVIGGPGDTVVMRDNRLAINGTPSRYERVDATEFEPVAARNNLGEIIESETVAGVTHLVTYTPGAGTHASFGPITIPDDHYFLMGDNRDNSLDSRMYGPVPHRSILGRITGGGH
jgi:signal peptidase I